MWYDDDDMMATTKLRHNNRMRLSVMKDWIYFFLCFFMEDVFVRLNIAIVWNKIILLMCICAYIYVYYVCNIILQDVFPDPGTYSSKIELNRFM